MISDCPARRHRLELPSVNCLYCRIGPAISAVLNQLRRTRFDMQATARAWAGTAARSPNARKGSASRRSWTHRGEAKAASALAGDPSLLRTVELKLMDHTAHLMETIAPFADVDEAFARLQAAIQEPARTTLQVRRNARAAAFSIQGVKSPAGSAVRPAQSHTPSIPNLPQ